MRLGRQAAVDELARHLPALTVVHLRRKAGTAVTERDIDDPHHSFSASHRDSIFLVEAANALALELQLDTQSHRCANRQLRVGIAGINHSVSRVGFIYGNGGNNDSWQLQGLGVTTTGGKKPCAANQIQPMPVPPSSASTSSQSAASIAADSEAPSTIFPTRPDLINA